MKKNKKNRNSVLSKQKPKRKIFRSLAKKLAKPLGITFLVAGFGFVLVSKVASLANHPSIKWEVTVHALHSDHGTETSAIAAAAAKILETNRRTDKTFETLASELQSSFLLRSVSIIRSDYNKLVVTVEKRSPVAAIEGKHLYLVDQDAEVYGEARGDGLKLPLLIGFLPQDKAQWERDHTMVTTAETKLAIMEALHLLDDAANQSLEVAKIRNIPQRGFELFIQRYRWPFTL
jgi:hypothetical protein